MTRAAWTGRLVAGALCIGAGFGATACGGSDSDDLGSAVLTVENLSVEVQGWRIRAEAFSPELDGSPTFYFSDEELVDSSTMTSEENTLGTRSYTLIVELAGPGSVDVRLCEAEFVIDPAERLDLTVDGTSIGETDPSGAPSVCVLGVERISEDD